MYRRRNSFLLVSRNASVRFTIKRCSFCVRTQMYRACSRISIMIAIYGPTTNRMIPEEDEFIG